MALIPADRLVDWTPGVRTGVIGGINQYYPGGGNERVNALNVKDSPYFAAGVNTETTGSITTGTDTLVVASASGWSVGNHIRVVQLEVQTLTVTAGASASGDIVVRMCLLGGGNPIFEDETVPVTSGDTTSQVATKIRAATYRAWTTGGSGNDVIFTQRDFSDVDSNVPSLLSAGGTGVTVSGAQTQDGFLGVASTATVESIVGTTLTLSENATATVTSGLVVHDDQPSIQAAIDAFTGDVVYLPAGTYRIYNRIGAGSLGYLLNDRTLRGELVGGEIATFIDQRTSGGIILGAGAGLSAPAVTTTSVSAGLTAGSTEVTLSGDLGDLAVGSIMVIAVENDDAIPVASVSGFNVFYQPEAIRAPTKQLVLISAIDGQDITFFPPLYSAYGNGSLATVIGRVTFPGKNQGLEDIDIDSENFYPGAEYNIQLNGVSGSWIRNCNAKHAKNYPIRFGYVLNCEIRHSLVQGPSNTGSNGAGILIGSWASLIEDNIILDTFPIIEMNDGAAGNAITYNYGSPDGMWNFNHAPHNQFNLFEGNYGGFGMTDGYFGGDNCLTVYRNCFHPDYYGMTAKRFNRNLSMVGTFTPYFLLPDEQGYPNIGNGLSTGTAEYSNADPWDDWAIPARLTTRTDDDHGVLTVQSGNGKMHNTATMRIYWNGGTEAASCTASNVSGTPGPNGGGTVADITRTSADVLPALNTDVVLWVGNLSLPTFQERDLDVGNTFHTLGNYNTTTDELESFAGETQVDSLAYSGTPQIFTDTGLTFPPYDTTNPATALPTRIPAGERYLNPPSSGSTSFDGSGSTIFTGSGSVTFA